MNARVLVTGLDHPEGVAYDPDADVVWAGGNGRLVRVDVDGSCETFALRPERWAVDAVRAGVSG